MKSEAHEKRAKKAGSVCEWAGHAPPGAGLRVILENPLNCLTGVVTVIAGRVPSKVDGNPSYPKVIAELKQERKTGTPMPLSNLPVFKQCQGKATALRTPEWSGNPSADAFASCEDLIRRRSLRSASA